eukprot:2107008-Heterocapsa_arctica.AAC.1
MRPAPIGRTRSGYGGHASGRAERDYERTNTTNGDSCTYGIENGADRIEQRNCSAICEAVARHTCSGLNCQGKFKGYGRSMLGNIMKNGDYARCTCECWKE